MQTNAEFSDFYSKPAIKMSIHQIKNCRLLNDTWQLKLTDKKGSQVLLTIPYIHIQGFIYQKVNDSTLTIKDSTGDVVKVIDCDKIANFGMQFIEQGVYSSVVGMIITNNSDVASIKAVKITSLKNKPNMELLWQWEINDLQQHLVKPNDFD